jgi:hypothetical protein
MSKWRINGAQIFRTSSTDKIELWLFRSLGSFSIVGQDVTKAMTFILAVNVADGQFLAVSYLIQPITSVLKNLHALC